MKIKYKPIKYLIDRPKDNLSIISLRKIKKFVNHLTCGAMVFTSKKSTKIDKLMFYCLSLFMAEYEHNLLYSSANVL